jgi:cytoskeleton protein RodZ
MSQGYYARHESSPGALLAAAREELNLSVSDVARHLKLSPAQVEALEEDAFDRLPGRVFVRGFLRNYAKLLGIDPQPLLRTIDHEMPQPAAVEEPPPSAEVVMPREQPARWPTYLGLTVMAVVILLAIYEFGFNEPAGSDGKPAAAPTATDVAPATPASPGAPAASAPVATTPAPAAGAPPSVPAKLPSGAAPVAGTEGTRAPGELVPSATEPAKAPAAGQRALRFRFEQDSWVEVRDRNDKIIFSKLNRAGSEERVNAAPPLKLVVGNARSVRLDYDDQPVDLAPHIGVTVARLTLQ